MGLQVADLPWNITVKCWKWEITEGKTTSLGRAELEAKLHGIYFFSSYFPSFLTLLWCFLVIDFMTFKMLIIILALIFFKSILHKMIL